MVRKPADHVCSCFWLFYGEIQHQWAAKFSFAWFPQMMILVNWKQWLCNRNKQLKLPVNDKTTDLRRWLHGKFQPRAEIPARSPGWNFVAIAWRVSTRVQAQFFHCRHYVSLNIPSMRLLKLKFQPGLKFCCDYIRFFSLPARDEHFQPGLKILARFQKQG